MHAKSSNMRYKTQIRIFLLCLFVFANTGASHADNGKYFGDSALYALSMQCLDSIRNPVSLEMGRRGLEEAVRKGNAHFDYVFRVIPLSHYRMTNNEEQFTAEARRLIAYYQQQAAETANIYRIWEMLIEHLRQKGDLTGNAAEIEQMAAYATRQGHRMGMAMANFFWGASYLDSGQREEAMQYYRKAYRLFREENNGGYAFRAALNIMAIYYEDGLSDKALALSDSLPPLISQWESEKKNINPVMRCKLAIYRTQNFCALGHRELAATELDSMEHYYRMYADYSLRSPVAYTRFLYARRYGNVKTAEEALRAVIAINERRRNAPLLVRYYKELAGLGKQSNDKALQLEVYEQFALWTDSADLQISNRQLNELSSRYRLKEMAWEKKEAEDKAQISSLYMRLAASVCIGLLLFLGGYIIYSRRLMQKNKILSHYILEQQLAQQKADEQPTVSPETEPEKDELLFRQLEEEMKANKIFCNPDLTRRNLSELLATNEAYLADAIRKFADGMTVKEYITAYRLKHVCHLLSTQRDLTVDAAGEMAGFNSRSTYFRLFREAFGLTPTEFRKSTL